MQTEEGRARTGCPNEQGTEVRSRMQARRLLPRRSIPPASPSCPQSPFVRITPFGWGGSGCLLERLRERRRSWPAQARRHICDRISACEQGFRALDSACFGVSPDALPRLARERRAQVRTAHEQHARKLVQAGRAPLVEHSLDGCLRLKGKSGPLMRRSTATCGIVAGARCGQRGHHLLDARLDKQRRTGRLHKGSPLTAGGPSAARSPRLWPISLRLCARTWPRSARRRTCASKPPSTSCACRSVTSTPTPPASCAA